MDFRSKCTTKDIKLLEKAGIELENKDYSKDELKKYEIKIGSFIISHSSKNGDIDKLNIEYSDILNVLSKCQ